MNLINLNNKLNNKRADLRGGSRKKNWSKKIFVVFLILIIFLGLPLTGTYFFGKKAIAGGKQVASALKQENLGQAKDGIITTKSAVDNLNISLTFLIWLKIIPIIGGYYSDVANISQALGDELQAVKTSVEILMPYEKELGFTGGTGVGEEKIAQVVKILDKLLPEIDKIEPSLKKAKSKVENIDTGKYPEYFGNFPVRNRIEETKNFIIGADIAVNAGKDALKLAPSALGEPTAKNYLILFQNDKEIRATGGFSTAYAFLNLNKGKLSTTVSDDIYRLDERLLKVCLNKICPLTPPLPIVKYLPEVSGKPRSAWSMRDSNISPDLPTSAKEFERMYTLLGEGMPFDGIITIDTQVVEELIKITGPIDVFGTTYSAKTDERCNCPNVVYELEHYAEVASKGESDRKAILGTLMQQMLSKILGSGTNKIPSILNAVVTLANDKHIMFYMHDPAMEQALSKLDWTGEIKKTNGDYLHINDSNFAGGKSNLYVTENVTLDIKIDKNNAVSNKLTIDYKNPQPYNTWLNGILRDYVRVYVPEGAKLTFSKGSDDSVNTLEDKDLGKTYFDAFVQVRPQNSRTLSFEYTLPQKISGKTYSLLIQKQPGAKDHHYVIKINGSTKAEFNLTSDKQLNLSY
ncbi:MAG: DUF4012 domain-containing protein [Candidatus Daviesbacteria bacterium]|nr:DUF4012 domain-containing protein [Candidatus Daviesbacteria bacterium]